MATAKVRDLYRVYASKWIAYFRVVRKQCCRVPDEDRKNDVVHCRTVKERECLVAHS